MRECILYGITMCICFTICCLTYYQYRDKLLANEHLLREHQAMRRERFQRRQQTNIRVSPKSNQTRVQKQTTLHVGEQKPDGKPPTIADVAASVESPVVLAAINKAFIQITENFLLSIRRLGLFPTILIVCEDRESYDILSKWENVTAVMTHLQLSVSGAEDWRSKAYNQLVDKRVPYILELLHNDKDVFFMDTDIVWLADPFPYVSGDIDIAVIHDYPQNYDKKVIYCAGYVYFRNTPTSKFVVHHWQKQLISPKRKEGSEQQGKLNKAIKKGYGRRGKMKLKLKVLPRNLFQAGFEFFNSSAPLEERNPRPVMIHNNWVVGLAPKLVRYKKYGLWYVDEDKNVTNSNELDG